MNNKIYISVVLATFNDELYIKESVNSILNQTYPHFELIIVNDGSTDSTLSILQSIEDDRIQIINQDNVGLAKSLNVGICASNYNWIARMDGDDIAMLNRFEEQVKYISDDVAVIGSEALFINEDGAPLYETHSPVTLDRDIKRRLTKCTPFIHPSVMINKKKLIEVGGYDENFTRIQDYNLWIRLKDKGEFIIIPKVLIKYRRFYYSDSFKDTYKTFVVNTLICKLVLFRSNVLPLSKTTYLNLVNRFSDSYVYRINLWTLITREQYPNSIIIKVVTKLVEITGSLILRFTINRLK
jgi:glycosyltransferase involved in cell wall biosynthesis